MEAAEHLLLARGRGKLGAGPVEAVLAGGGADRRGRGAGWLLLRAAGGLGGRVHHGRAGHRGERRALRPAVEPVPGRRVPAAPVGCGGRVRDGEPARGGAGPVYRRGTVAGGGPAGMPRPGMVVLADRNFLSWSLARAVLATGAHVLWRASSSFALRPVKVLADGTYLAELRPPRKKDGPAITVRVIEYTVHTAAEPAAGSPRRCSPWSPTCWTRRSTRRWTWRAATRSDGVRDRHRPPQDRHGRGPARPALRDPEGVAQEMWALFAVYQAICKLIGIGAIAMGIPPDGSASRMPWPPRPVRSRLSPLTSWTSPSPRSC